MRFAKSMLVGGGLLPLLLHASPVAAEEHAELTIGVYGFTRLDGGEQHCDLWTQWISTIDDDPNGGYLVGPMRADVQVVDMWGEEGSNCDVASGSIELYYQDTSGHRQMARTNFYDAGYHDVEVSEAAPWPVVSFSVVTITWADCDAAVSTCTVTQLTPEK